MIVHGTCAVFVLRDGAALALKKTYLCVLMWYSAEGQMWRLSVVAVMPARTGYMEVKSESCGEISSTDAKLCCVCHRKNEEQPGELDAEESDKRVSA